MTTEISFRRETNPLTLLRWRGEVLLNVFGRMNRRQLTRLLQVNASYLRRHLADGSLIEVITSVNGEEAGCGSVSFYDEMPSPDNPTGRCAYIMNIYVRQAFRRRGAADATVRLLISLARRRGAGKIYLESTDCACNLYKKIGFRPMNGYLKL